MPDFKQSQQQLQQTRQQAQTRQHKIFLSKQQLKRIAEQEKALQRKFNPDNNAHVLRQRQLENKRRGTERDLAKWQSSLADIQGELAEWIGAFQAFTDPREHIRTLDDRIPILMFPVRVETRFKEVVTPNGSFPELWVRIFPDECLVDTYEEDFSEMELKSAGQYWTERWAAGSIEVGDRAAWTGLVNNHGTGRAAWIANRYSQLFADNSIPQKAEATDVFLIISNTQLPAAAEQDALGLYWALVWQNDELPAAQQTAYNTLVDTIGQERADALIEAYRPNNFNERPAKPLTKQDVSVQTLWLELPDSEEIEATLHSWSQPPRTHLMPDRFVLRLQAGNTWKEHIGNLIPQPLILGMDPSAEEDEMLQKEEGQLQLPEDIRWMEDFDEAVRIGLGFRIGLNETERIRGFEKLQVVGIRLSADAETNRSLVEELFDHHHYSSKGMELIPQGTPTNNTEKADAGYTYLDDAESSYDRYILGMNILEPETDDTKKRDGQWLAEFLNINSDIVADMANANGRDICELRAMNTALWPSTLGYFMDSMMGEVFSKADSSNTRRFFTQYVLGSGRIPAIRIGEQPYGILPTTTWSKAQWLDDWLKNSSIPGAGRTDPWVTYIRRLYSILQKIDADWTPLMDEVSYVGKRGADVDPQQILLDVLGLHPSSAEFYQRYAMTAEQLHNIFRAYGTLGSILAAIIAGGYIKSGTDLLKTFGYDTDLDDNEVPEVLTKFFLKKQTKLKKRRLIDNRKLSETKPIRPYTDDGKNYIQWLREAAASDLEIIRKQTGFKDNRRPNTLLYALLRHGLQLSYWRGAYNLYENTAAPDRYFLNRRQAPFVHLQEEQPQAASRYELLYKDDVAITGNDDGMTIAQFIPGIIRTNPLLGELREIIDALEHLETASTASLLRALETHNDCCTYRLDAWQQGIVGLQLERMNQLRSQSDDIVDGMHIGAFAWLENVRPEGKVLEPASIDPALSDIFEPNAEPQLMTDSTNQGYIHAPSLNHAVTAAVLRNGYLSNATPENPGLLGVNLSSERVRQAMLMIEGIRQGQSIGALLGYQFERALHDNEQLAETDEFIYDLRKKFPLVADNIIPTRSADDDNIKLVEARNVIDGEKLVKHVEEANNFSYPFGKEGLPTATPAQRQKINNALDHIRNISDAVADLGVAESVYQATLGNTERAAASLDAYSKGGLPPIPQVVQTPRSGRQLTHRFSLHFDPNADPTVSPWAGISMSVRAQAEPAINAWLATLLPAPEQIIVHAHRADLDSLRKMNVQDLGWQPIDLLYLLQLDAQRQMSELDERILAHYIAAETNDGQAPRPDVAIEIRYKQAGEADEVTLFELSALIYQLRGVLLSSRPLQATDIQLANEAQESTDLLPILDVNRITLASQQLANILTDLQTFTTALQPLVEDIETNRDALIQQAEARLQTFLDLAIRAGQYLHLNAGRSFTYAWKRRFFEQLISKVSTLTDDWQDRLDEFDTKLTAYTALPPATPDEERIVLLNELELLVSTSFTPADGQTPAGIEAIAAAKRSAFANKRTAMLNDIVETDTTDMNSLLATAQSHLPLQDFRWETITFEEEEQLLIALNTELLRIALALEVEVTNTQTAATDGLQAHTDAATAQAKVKALQTVAHKLFGEDFRLVPHFALTADQQDLLRNVATPNTLLQHLRDNNISAFPMDEWLYGLARVRPKMKHWEQLSFLSEGFTANEPSLRPMQLPLQENDTWLGLEFPDTYEIESDKLLYTAHHATPFDVDQPQCGLLLDEWTEVIPNKEETTGLVFHYDTPNSEPPQSLLLVTPSRIDGSWSWAELTDALEETLERAKKRALEPDIIDNTAYARFLPASIMAVTKHPIIMSLNLATINNNNVEL